MCCDTKVAIFCGNYNHRISACLFTHKTMQRHNSSASEPISTIFDPAVSKTAGLMKANAQDWL